MFQKSVCPTEGVGIKCPEIPQLDNYANVPPESFWLSFPSRPIPSTAVCSVNVNNLESMVPSLKDKLTVCEFERATKCIENLKFGASAYQKQPLPSCLCDNAKSAVVNGRNVTDVVGSWIKKGFVAGPFDSPPLDKFRVNSLMAIKQGHKVRPVLNVSLPKSASLNDSVDCLAVEKVKMSTAKKFSYSVIEAGKGSLITKFDMVDAYKNVPAKPADLRLQGFSWLQKYFIELRLIFGAKTAVTNYDVLSNTAATLAKAECEIPAHLVHRILDDVPFVAPASSTMNQKFCSSYTEICKQAEIQLAPDCPEFDKAFKHSTYAKC